LVELRRINAHTRLGLLDLARYSALGQSGGKRDNERKATQYLLKELLNTEDFLLGYTVHNKPYLEGRREHISISHSHDKLAIIVNEKENTGIDIELVRDKVLNIREKFLSPNELAFAANDVEKLITLWACKEAMYKVHGNKELEFASDLLVEPFSSSEIRGHITHQGFRKSFLMQGETIDNYKMVYVLHEI
jgi:phosphopantetheinyl transferase